MEPKVALASSVFNETFNLRYKLSDILGSCLMKWLPTEALHSNSVPIIWGD